MDHIVIKFYLFLEKYNNFKWLGPLQYPDKVREYLTEIDVYALVSGIDMSPLIATRSTIDEKTCCCYKCWWNTRIDEG